MSKPKIDFDELNRPHWIDADREKVRVAIDFGQELIINHEFDRTARKFSDSPYVQHNPYVGSGLKPVIEFTEMLVKRFPEFAYDVKRVFVDGDFVIFHSHATLKAKHRGNDRKGMVVMDVWRIVDGKIVEHWDSIQPLDWLMRLFLLLGGGRRANNNGVF